LLGSGTFPCATQDSDENQGGGTARITKMRTGGSQWRSSSGANSRVNGKVNRADASKYQLFKRGAICSGVTKQNKSRTPDDESLEKRYNFGAGEMIQFQIWNRGKKDKGERQVKTQRKLRFLAQRVARAGNDGKACLSTRAPVIGANYSDAALQSGLRILATAYGPRCRKTGGRSRKKRRLDYLAEMGTSILTSAEGETVDGHTELEEVSATSAATAMIEGMITNGFLLSKERIASLNAAGLENLTDQH